MLQPQTGLLQSQLTEAMAALESTRRALGEERDSRERLEAAMQAAAARTAKLERQHGEKIESMQSMIRGCDQQNARRVRLSCSARRACLALPRAPVLLCPACLSARSL